MKINESHHPLKKAKKRPENDIAKDINIQANLSPTALWIAKHSLLNLAESSEGLMESNQAISYLKTD